MTLTVRAVSLWPPWGTFVARGQKRVETRSWPAQPGWLAIHQTGSYRKVVASACTRPGLFADLIREAGYQSHLALPLGCVVALAYLEECVSTSRESDMARLDLSDRERAVGDYSLRRYAWVFSAVHELPDPVRCGGRQRLWAWDAEAGAPAACTDFVRRVLAGGSPQPSPFPQPVIR